MLLRLRLSAYQMLAVLVVSAIFMQWAAVAVARLLGLELLGFRAMLAVLVAEQYQIVQQGELEVRELLVKEMLGVRAILVPPKEVRAAGVRLLQVQLILEQTATLAEQAALAQQTLLPVHL